jgi:hypothetical protein
VEGVGLDSLVVVAWLALELDDDFPAAASFPTAVYIESCAVRPAVAEVRSVLSRLDRKITSRIVRQLHALELKNESSEAEDAAMRKGAIVKFFYCLRSEQPGPDFARCTHCRSRVPFLQTPGYVRYARCRPASGTVGARAEICIDSGRAQRETFVRLYLSTALASGPS